jgi:hypothetical protein
LRRGASGAEAAAPAAVERQVVTGSAAARLLARCARRYDVRPPAAGMAPWWCGPGPGATSWWCGDCLPGSVAWRRSGAHLLRQGKWRKVTGRVEAACGGTGGGVRWVVGPARASLHASHVGAVERWRFNSAAYGCRRRHLSAVVIVAVLLERRAQAGAVGSDAPGESLMAAASSDVALPAGGVILELHLHHTLVSG